MSPAIILKSVVFPAPLGPSNPVIPGPNEQETLETATFWPNHLEISLISMVGLGTKAGEVVIT